MSKLKIVVRCALAIYAFAVAYYAAINDMYSIAAAAIVLLLWADSKMFGKNA